MIFKVSKDSFEVNYIELFKLESSIVQNLATRTWSVDFERVRTR